SPEPVVIALAGVPVATSGPMRVPDRRPFVARFLDARIPPGMLTRHHSHQVPEACYVADGAQRDETTDANAQLGTGEGYHLDAERATQHGAGAVPRRRAMDGPDARLDANRLLQRPRRSYAIFGGLSRRNSLPRSL